MDSSERSGHGTARVLLRDSYPQWGNLWEKIETIDGAIDISEICKNNT